MRREVPHFRIGLLLTEAGIITPEQLDGALKSGEGTGVPFLRVLVNSNLLSQHELQAVVRAQSLIWKGLLDVDRAIMALAKVHTDSVNMDDALKSVGWVRSDAPPAVPFPAPPNPSGVGAPVQRPPLLSSVPPLPSAPPQSGPGSGPTPVMVPALEQKSAQRECQYCGSQLAADATWCYFCTGDIPQQTAGGTVKAAPATRGSGAYATRRTGAIEATSVPRDPLVMAFLSGCCIPGLGQFLLGQAIKGCIIAFVSIAVIVATGGMASLICFPLAGLDAFLLADKLKRGRGIGLWESF